jgi:hypothetical protein
MKKLLIVPALLTATLLLVWCGDQNEETTTNQISNEDNNICENSEWELINRAEWWDVTVCWYNDWTFCFLEDLKSWDCEKWILPINDEEEKSNIEENVTEEPAEFEVKDCEQMEKDVVCGKDWNTYFNRCYLEASWIEEAETAHAENWECVFD